MEITRLAYRRRGCDNLYPAAAMLNVPEERHSHGLRRLAAIEGSRGSFEEARTAIERATGQKLGKRQLETLVQRAAADFDGFDEADRRDPGHQRTWVALVDGNNNQLDLIQAEARVRQLRVAAAIRRKAARDCFDRGSRTVAKRSADYLTRKRPYLNYPTALERGWPIATGVIEGACRHLVKDRMDITGARWGLDGAEAVLKLRTLISNGDFAEYWRYHLNRERFRVHDARYANGTIPKAAQCACREAAPYSLYSLRIRSRSVPPFID